MQGKPPFTIRPNSRQEKYLKILIYGVHGAGKTYLAGTSSDVESMQDVIMLSVEGGDLTLDDEIHGFENIDVVQARTFGAITAFQKYLLGHCQIRDNPHEASLERLLASERWLKGDDSIVEPKRYKTVIIDSLSEIDQIHRHKLQGIDDDTSLDVDLGDSSWALFNQNLSKITRFVKIMRDLPINVILTCAASYSQDHLNRMRYQPKLVGQLRTDVQGVVDIVGFLEAGDVDVETGEQPRRLWVMPSSTHDAKCRWSRNKNPFFFQPTLRGILAGIGLAGD